MFLLRRTDDANHWMAVCEICNKEFTTVMDGKSWSMNNFQFLSNLQMHWETRNLAGVCKVPVPLVVTT